MDNSGEGGGSLGYYKALGGSGKSGGDIFHNLPPPPPPHPHPGQLGLFGMLSFSHKLKIIVEVAFRNTCDRSSVSKDESRGKVEIRSWSIGVCPG